MREITEEWIFKAENDYRSAEALLYVVEIPIVDTACFHCQQCTEKYVKAYEEQEVDFPRNHNLMQYWICAFNWTKVSRQSGVHCRALSNTQLPFVIRD